MIKFLYSILLILFFSSYSFSYDPQIKEFENQIIKEEKTLKKIKKDIQKKTKAITKLRRKERAIISQLEKIEKELINNKKAIWRLKKKIKIKKEEIRKARKKITKANSKLNIYRKNLAYLLLNMYKYKNRGYLEYILSSRDWCEFIKRYKFLTLLALSYGDIVRRVEHQKNIILNQKRSLTKSYRRLNFLKEEKSKLYQSQLIKERKKKRLLLKVKNDKRLYLSQIEYLKEASLRIRRLIQRLEEQKKKREEISILAKIRFQADKGFLKWPVSSKKILRSYGKIKHKKFKAYTFNKGIDIGINERSTVYCIKTGKVVFADWFRGYGQMVMVDHGSGYYTLYSNLDHITVHNGNIIQKMSPIGIIDGDSYLHFEIRINGNPVNPLLWLEK